MFKSRVRTLILSILASVLLFLLFAGMYVGLQPYPDHEDFIAGFAPVGSRDLPLAQESGEWVFHTDEARSFRILQLTDLHIGGNNVSAKKDRQAMEAVYRLCKYARPDLIVITGDMLYATPYTLSVNNASAAKIFTRFMDRLGIPWTVTFGNHDAESYNTLDKDALEAYFRDSSQRCLMPPKPAVSQAGVPVSGNGNQFILLRDGAGSCFYALVLLDSHGYLSKLPRRYDTVHEDQAEWYRGRVLELCRAEGRIVPSAMFLHIPLAAYASAWQDYERGGSTALIYGEKREKIHVSPRESHLFDYILQLNSTKAVFCGHDHVNDFSLEYRGVRLTCGKSIDYLAYPTIFAKTAQRGGTVIDIVAGDTEITPVRLSDLSD